MAGGTCVRGRIGSRKGWRGWEKELEVYSGPSEGTESLEQRRQRSQEVQILLTGVLPTWTSSFYYPCPLLQAILERRQWKKGWVESPP